MDGLRAPCEQRPTPAAEESRSCLHHLQVKRAALLTERENLALRPAVGRGQGVNVVKQATCAGLNLRPEPRGNVERLPPFMAAFGADKVEQSFSKRVGLCKQVADSVEIVVVEFAFLGADEPQEIERGSALVDLVNNTCKVAAGEGANAGATLREQCGGPAMLQQQRGVKR